MNKINTIVFVIGSYCDNYCIPSTCSHGSDLFGGGGGGEELGDFPLTGFTPLKISNYNNNTCNIYQIETILLLVYVATRSLRGRNLKIFLVEHAPRPP